MSASIQQIKSALKSCRFESLFLELLGWDHLHKSAAQSISYRGQEYRFTPLAHKAEFKVYLHIFDGPLPAESLLKHLDRALDLHAVEHMTIFVDANKENQVWLWTKKVHGQTTRSRVNWLRKQESGERLARRIMELEVDLHEEEEQAPTLIEMRKRAGKAFDPEKVTKTFYKDFEEQHEKFLVYVENILDLDDRKWYTSLMLNRLMFIYFIQQQGILDNRRADIFAGDRDYLNERLKMVRKSNGPDNFYKFYRYFLLHLFHDGLSKREEERSPEMESIIGRIPYLNGGLFEKHQLEEKYPEIQISDAAFEDLFKLFDGYGWTLDDRPESSNDNEINPFSRVRVQ